MTDNTQRSPENPSSKPHSIYVWFVGLGLGALIILCVLTVLLWKVANPAHVRHREEREAEKSAKAAQERLAELMAEGQKRLDNQPAPAPDPAPEARELEKLQLQNEIQKTKQRGEIDRKRFEEKAERDKESRKLQAAEKKRFAEEKAEELRRRQQRQDAKSEIKAETEVERLRLQRIDDDHKAILAYMKANLQTVDRRTNFIWETPAPAVSAKVDKESNVFGPLGEKLTADDDFVGKEGLLYRLQGRVEEGGIVGVNEKPRPNTFSYYFLVSDGQVIRFQEANNSNSLTMCKVLK